MAHARTQIRQALAALLASTGRPVVAGRVYPDGGPLPAYTLLVDSEDTNVADHEVMGELSQARILVMNIEIRAQATPTVDDELDAECLAVERALNADPTLGGLTEWATYTGVQYELDDQHAQPLGLATLSYSIEYRVDRADPEQIVT